MINEIYEASDQTSDEVYMTLGIWLNLPDAVNALTVDNPEMLDAHNSCDSGHYKVLVKRRGIGFGDSGETVYELNWSYCIESNQWTLTHDKKEK